MYFTIARKQNYIYILSLMLVSIMTTILYFKTQSKWIIFKEAEHKYEAKEFAAAIPLYKKSIAEGVTTKEAYINLASAYEATRLFPEAISVYKVYLQLHPEDNQVHIKYARALSWNGNFEESQKEYQKILEQSHENLH